MGFGQGLSGLKAQAQKLDVIGNNIANAGTVGFKSSTVSFADVYATSRVGLGTSVAAVNQNFGVGVISSTGGQFDMAIDGGSGMFRVIDTNGNVLYTRNGEFHADKEGWIVNAQGYRLTGYPPGSTAPQPVRVPSGNIAPQETSRIETVVNVDANVTPIGAGAGAGAGTPEVLGELVDTATPANTYYFVVDDAGVYSWVNADGTPGGTAPPDGLFTSPTGTVNFAAGQPDDVADFDNAIQTAYVAAVPAGAGTPAVPGVLIDTATPANTYHFVVDDAGVYSWVNADGTPGGTAPPDGLFTSPTGTVNFAAGQPDDATDFDNAIQSAYVPAVAGGGGGGGVGVAFDPLDPDSFHHKLPLTVYDALGNPHQIEQYFIKRPGAGAGDPPHWEVQYVTTTRDTSGAQLTLSPSSALIEFNSRGEFVATNPADLSLELTLDNTVAPTVPLTIQLNYAGSTQFGGEFSYAFDQDGYSTGEYSSMSVGPNGEIIAAYTNGEVQEMGHLVLANFSNLQGLQPVGGNAWRETSESGQPILGAPGTNGMSLIKGQSLEESNVDMGTELVNMIITQRTYQANAQTITTQSEVLQTLLNIR